VSSCTIEYQHQTSNHSKPQLYSQIFYCMNLTTSWNLAVATTELCCPFFLYSVVQIQHKTRDVKQGECMYTSINQPHTRMEVNSSDGCATTAIFAVIVRAVGFVILGWDGILWVQHYEGGFQHTTFLLAHTQFLHPYHALQRREDAFHGAYHRVLDVVVIVIVVSSAVCVLTTTVAIMTANSQLNRVLCDPIHTICTGAGTRKKKAQHKIQYWGPRQKSFKTLRSLTYKAIPNARLTHVRKITVYKPVPCIE
jgi:hypothetical protein